MLLYHYDIYNCKSETFICHVKRILLPHTFQLDIIVALRFRDFDPFKCKVGNSWSVIDIRIHCIKEIDER